MDEKITRHFMPVLDKLYNTEPAAEPFRYPVDLVKYGCLDYYDYVKHPIDLGTIRERLSRRQYKDAWRLVADIELMFSNAYLFNKKGTTVYDYTNKLSRIWGAELGPTMRALNYCCAQLHKFGPQLLFCHGTTADRYCQIAIGARYKCYQDQYSFCLACFNKIDSDTVNIQSLSCETTRMKLPQHPVKKSHFKDCSNDSWQYEAFVQCSKCTRRNHQICELYPASEHQLNQCVQHEQIVADQKEMYQIPVPNQPPGDGTLDTNNRPSTTTTTTTQPSALPLPLPATLQPPAPPDPPPPPPPALPSVPQQEVNQVENNNNNNKWENLCNHCYRKRNVGYNMRHRKFSARRLPHTRMSRYIETKVNEHLREISPQAGHVTIRVLTSYRDIIEVKPEMQAYVERCRQKPFTLQHPNAKDYPQTFAFTNRAIFAWQDIDGVDVCVFGMHIQEYGEDCQEPNKQVIYLSYLDSVHFFRPKQYRTTVYHEILLSYFKYAKKLGFRRVFIWVCPSRKGDDYIFYRHPNEQKMPTLRRLSDWYLNLLDKGVMAGIVEKHQSIYQFVASQNDMSPLSMPYLSGDYWPGEFERLLKIMIDSEGQYSVKMQKYENTKNTQAALAEQDIFASRYRCIGPGDNLLLNAFQAARTRHSLATTTQNLYDSQPNYNPRCSLINSLRLRTPSQFSSGGGAGGGATRLFTPDGDLNISITTNNESKLFNGALTPDSSKSDYDQPLDLSKSSSNNSPESFFDEDRMSELSLTTTFDNRKKRSRAYSFSGARGKKKTKTQPLAIQDSSFSGRRTSSRNVQYLANYDASSCNSIKPTTKKSATQSQRDSVYGDTPPCSPEMEFMKNLEKSLKRQREGFIVTRLNDCDCPPNFENQRRKEEVNVVCDLMKGREPFLQLTRQKNYEFSTLRRAKFSSLAMVKHLAETFKLNPLCNECYSFDSSKRHYACTRCEDFYLCTSCHENTQHDHIMSIMAPTVLPDIEEFLQQCSLGPASISISSASSTVSNTSYGDNNIEIAPSHSSLALQHKQSSTHPATPFNHHLTKSSIPSTITTTTTMPLSCQRQNNHLSDSQTRHGDEENSELCPFNSNSTTKSRLTGNMGSLSPGRSSDNNTEFNINLDQILIENFVRQAEVTYDLDFDQMKSESKKLLTHYWNCANRESCHKCKFVVLSCSFMSAFMKSPRMQMMINQCNPSEIMPNISNSNLSGINLSTTHQVGYQSKEK